jgi:hypothetical protein
VATAHEGARNVAGELGFVFDYKNAHRGKRGELDGRRIARSFAGWGEGSSAGEASGGGDG